MERVTLFKLENKEGQLIFDGYDIGKSVEECFGDSDYEYNYTIEPTEVQKLYSIFGIPHHDKHSLLFEIKKRFEGNQAFSNFGTFMRENNIDYSAASWT